MGKNSSVYTTKVIAQLLNLSERRIKQLAEEGIISEHSPGYFKLAPTVQGYVKYLQSLVSDDDKASDMNHEKALLYKIKREDAELDYRQKKNELHKAEDVAFLWTNAIVAFKGKMKTLPSKIIPKLMNIPRDGREREQMRQILNKEIDAALMELSEYEPEQYGDADLYADDME